MKVIFIKNICMHHGFHNNTNQHNSFKMKTKKNSWFYCIFDQINATDDRPTPNLTPKPLNSSEYVEARLSKTNALNSICYHFRGLGSGMNPLDHCHCTFIELMCSFQSLIVHGHHLFLCSTDRVTWVWNVMQVSKLKKLYFRSVLSQTLCNKPSNIISVYTVLSIHENWQRTQHIPHLERRAVSVLHSVFFYLVSLCPLGHDDSDLAEYTHSRKTWATGCSNEICINCVADSQKVTVLAARTGNIKHCSPESWWCALWFYSQRLFHNSW